MARSHANHAKDHLPWGSDPVGRAVYHIKVSGDEDTPGATALTAGDAQFVFMVPWDCDYYWLASVAIFVTTASSSGDPTVQLRNITQSNTDLLSTPVSVDAGETSVGTSAVVDRTVARLRHRDLLAIDVDIAGTDTWGLGVILELGFGIQT